MSLQHVAIFLMLDHEEDGAILFIKFLFGM